MWKRFLGEKNSTHSMVAFMSASNLFSHVLTMASGLLVAKWMLPEELGFYNGFSIVTSYIILSQLGIPSGLSRELPYYMGKGEPEKAREVAAVANCYELLLGFILLISATVVAVGFLLLQNYPYAAGAFVVGVTSFEAVYVSKYLMILYRSNDDFNKLALINVVVSIASAVSVLLVWKLAFYGLCLRALVVFAVQFALVWRWRPIDVRPRWDKAIFREILHVGMPIYWVANVYSLWPVFQRTAVISCLGVRALGLYALALMVDNSMKIVSNTLASVTFPKMSFAWGKGVSFGELLRQSTKIILATFGLNTVLAVVGWLLLPLFVETFLPNYRDGIAAAQWMLLAGALSSFGVYSNVYMVVKRNTERLISYVAAMLVWAASLLILLQWRGPVLEIMPQSLLVAYAAMYLVNGWHFRKYVRIDLRA